MSESFEVDDFDALRRSVGWSMTRPPAVVRQQVHALFAEAHGTAPLREHAVAERVRERELLVVRDDDHVEHLVYASRVADVTVRIDGDTVTGQVLPILRPTPGAFAVTVIDGPMSARSSDGDASGAFTLTGLPDGEYRLMLDNTHLEIELEVVVGGDR